MSDEITNVKRAIAMHNAIIFVGNDVSRYTTNDQRDVPIWMGLIKDGLQRCHQLGWIDNIDFEHITNELNSSRATAYEYLNAAEQIKSFLENESDKTKNDVYKLWLNDAIGQLRSKNPGLIKAIGELGCPIVTTNYDGLLEEVLKKKPLTWNQYQTDGIGNSFEELKNLILHVHGYYQEPASVIFTGDDYRKILDEEFVQSKLKSLLEKKVIICIGYSFKMTDPSFSNLLQLKHRIDDQNSSPIYMLANSNDDTSLHRLSKLFLLDNVRKLTYGENDQDLLEFIRNLQSLTPLLNHSLSSIEKKTIVHKKYLNFLIKEYGLVSIFGNSQTNINLPLERVYVELKFDPTHPSIKAMKMLEVTEEFKRQISSYDFFNENEKRKILRGIMEMNGYNPQNFYRDLMMEPWLDLFLSNHNIFTREETIWIRNKIHQLKRKIAGRSNIKEAKQYRIQEAYNEFKHAIFLGHPGSGKTTISKWLVINMAKQCLNEENMLLDHRYPNESKLPILIPIWKYVDHQLKQNQNEKKKSLLQYIYENPILDSNDFNEEEKQILSTIIMQSLIQGETLVIFEGLDEVPVHVDRTSLMKEINSLLERGIDYDAKMDKLCYSMNERKEINSTHTLTSGNRFIVTSRIEGNYFEEINFYVPRLTIEDMSSEALQSFCSSYTECIKGALVTDDMIVGGFKTNKLYDDITKNKDIFQLAINPQLASIIAAIYNQNEDKLPEKRIDLYDKAIEKMIERLTNTSSSSSTSYLSEELGLNSTLLWSIMQEIAEYLHSRVEGLQENILKDIIRKCFMDYQKQSSKQFLIATDDTILKLVDVFKYQSGLLNEFGHNSFRFIHRTFQEYLAAKSIIYFNGVQRNEDTIVKSIQEKITNPNWRVPLSMMFGILSKLTQSNGVFINIIEKLFNDEQFSSSMQSSTSLIPYVIIDSLNDMFFSSKYIEHLLIRQLLEHLIIDYKNMLGFSRLKEHQKLLQSYFSKLKKSYSDLMTIWLIEKMKDEENIAPCAKIIYDLKWYDPKFHEIFLKNLHNDSVIWNWPIDSILRFYSTKVEQECVTLTLKFKNALSKNPKIVKYIINNSDWLRLVTVLYGGYKNYNTTTSIQEHFEIVQFLRLTDHERTPFLFYYQELWGRGNTTYNMGVYADTRVSKERWNEKPIFNKDEIYKESYLTNKILDLLAENKTINELMEHLQVQINSQKLSAGEKIDTFLALVAMGNFDGINTLFRGLEVNLIDSFANRVEQVMYILRDPIARCSSKLSNYLLTTYNAIKMGDFKCSISFPDYCKIYLSLLSDCGGLPVDTSKLAEAMDDSEDKFDLIAEYFAFKFTGASNDQQYSAAETLDVMGKYEVAQIVKPVMKISNCVQIYKPVPSYVWPIDTFNFKWNNYNDLPISFFNCLENIHSSIASTTDVISEIMLNKGYFENNPELIIPVILLNFGTMSKDVNYRTLCNRLLPELIDETNIKEALLRKIDSIGNPYYKSRALCQLAQFYDSKSYELLHKSFYFTKSIEEPVLKFQVLEKIYSITHYKKVERKDLIKEILDELVSSLNDITDHYDRTIALVRLSFYGSDDFRKKYLNQAIETLGSIDEEEEQAKLIIKLKPLIAIYDDLQVGFNGIIETLKNKMYKHYINSYYGRILFTERLNANLSSSAFMDVEIKDYTGKELMDDCSECNINNDEKVVHRSKYIDMEVLFLLYAELNDIRLELNKIKDLDQLWINLCKDPNNQTNVENLLKVALKNELILTPNAAVIIDELVRNGNEDKISLFYPYIIKPSNEVLPIVHRWFTDYSDSEIKRLATLLLTEIKYVFEAGIDTIIDLLKCNNDQIRYRAQRVLQHPERDVDIPSKRISVIGEKTLFKIIQERATKEHLPRVQIYLSTFFFDLFWDDPNVFQSLYEYVAELKQRDPSTLTRKFFNNIYFLNNETWKSILKTAETTSQPTFVEEVLQIIMSTSRQLQVQEQDWNTFVQILNSTDINQFKEKIYFTEDEIYTIRIIIRILCESIDVQDEAYLQLLDSKVMSELSIQSKDLSQSSLDDIREFNRCNFRISTCTLNSDLLNMLDESAITPNIMEILIKWLLEKMSNFKGFSDTVFSTRFLDRLLSLVAAYAQKDNCLYRKITNAQGFHKSRMIKLLETILHNHSAFMARGCAFILLSALDHCDQKVITNALNVLFDENLVKEYCLLGIPLIHLSPNEFIDDLLKLLNNDSAIKAYEILKILTQYTLEEKIDAQTKSKIIAYLTKEIGEFKSKKPINYYYTDMKIPFTTTLENKLYKAWTKIQGLSGKVQYYIDVEAPKD